jgi:hypothetical protein
MTDLGLAVIESLDAAQANAPAERTVFEVEG